MRLGIVARAAGAAPLAGARFLGVSGTPPLIGLNGSGAGDGLPNDAPILLQPFSSMDGGRTWIQVPNFNLRLSPIVSLPPDQP
jgi:hypothetical protein